MEEGDNSVNNVHAVHFLIMNCSYSNLIMTVTQVAPVQLKRKNVRIMRRSDEESDNRDEPLTAKYFLYSHTHVSQIADSRECVNFNDQFLRYYQTIARRSTGSRACNKKRYRVPIDGNTGASGRPFLSESLFF